MPADDAIKPAVVAALVKDGWAITRDPLTVEVDDLYVFIDLAGQRGTERIAVEIKSFPSKSMVADLQQAIGQFVMYRFLLADDDPGRSLFVAVSAETFGRVFAAGAGRRLRDELAMPLVVVDTTTEEVVRWIR